MVGKTLATINPMRTYCCTLLLIGLCTLQGCSRQRDPAILASAEQNLDAAKEAMDRQDYAAALELLNQSVSAGGLFVDLLSDAHLRRAECLARLGQYDDALQILTEQAAGTPHLARLSAIRSFVYQKKGNTVEAGKAWREALKFDPTIQKLKP